MTRSKAHSRHSAKWTDCNILSCVPFFSCWASLVAQTVKNPPATQDTWVQSLGWEDPLEKRMVTPSGDLAWRIPWTEKPGRLPWGLKESDTTERLTLSLSLVSQK